MGFVKESGQQSAFSGQPENGTRIARIIRICAEKKSKVSVSIRPIRAIRVRLPAERSKLTKIYANLCSCRIPWPPYPGYPGYPDDPDGREAMHA